MMYSVVATVPVAAVIKGFAPAPFFLKTTGLARVPVVVISPAVCDEKVSV